jgi:hypothetical protein
MPHDPTTPREIIVLLAEEFAIAAGRAAFTTLSAKEAVS